MTQTPQSARDALSIMTPFLMGLLHWHAHTYINCTGGFIGSCGDLLDPLIQSYMLLRSIAHAESKSNHPYSTRFLRAYRAEETQLLPDHCDAGAPIPLRLSQSNSLGDNQCCEGTLTCD